MSEHEKETKSGWLQPVVGAILVALFAGGTAPWWWQAALQGGADKGNNLQPPTSSTVGVETFNLLGKWNGSPDCIVRFFLDDGKMLKVSVT
jgi:hypothetical protein